MPIHIKRSIHFSLAILPFLLFSLRFSAAPVGTAITSIPNGRQTPLVSPEFKPAAGNTYIWHQVKIIDGGVMPGLFMHPAKRGLMYIKGDVGGAYRWDSAANEWIPITDWVSGGSPDWNLMGIESIALDPTDSNRVYLAAGTGIDEYYSDGAILISVDKGVTFRRVNLPFKLGGNDLTHGQQSGERLAVNPFEPNELYLGTHENGLWSSSDYGSTWSQMASFPVKTSPDKVGVLFIRFDPRRRGAVYAGVYEGGIYRSVDDGVTWEQMPGQPATLPDGETLRPMRCAFGPDGVLYITYANSAGLLSINDGAVYKLDTATGIWTDITPPEKGKLWYGYCGVGADASRKGTVMVATWNRWWPGDDIYRSTDGGATWRSLKQYSVRDTSLSPYLNTTLPTFGTWNASLEIDPFDSNHAIYSSGFTVWSTHDLTRMDARQPTHWTVGANGIEEAVVHQVISPPSGPHLYSAMADLGGFRHDNLFLSPAPFVNPFMIEVASLDFAESNPGFLVRVGLLDYKGKIAAAYSHDGGLTWKPYPNTPPGAGPGPDNDGYAATVAVSADGTTVVWAPGDSVPAYIRNTDSWISSKGAPTGLKVVSDRVNPNKFYGYDSTSGAIFVSTDRGVSFVRGASGLPIDYGRPGWTSEGQPKTVFGHEGDIWLPLGNGLFHSTDSGAVFHRIGALDGATEVGFGKAAPGASYPAIYVIGTENGVYGVFSSIDGGASWRRINDDAHQYGMLGAISGDPRIYGRVYIATQGRGIIYGDIFSKGVQPLH